MTSGNLGFSKIESEKIINERIFEIQSLMKHFERDGGNVYEEIAQFENDLYNWRDLNSDFLKKMFPDREIVKKYEATTSGGLLVVSQSVFDQYQVLKKEIESEITYLKNCIRKLQFFEEPSNAQHIFTANQQFSAFLVLNDIVKSAKQNILLVDGYVDENTLNILSGKSSGVVIRILTKVKSVSNNFKSASNSFAKQHGSLEIKTSDLYHDRFLIVDDSSIYQSGGSIKDLGARAATLLQVTTPMFANQMIAQIQSDWSSASTVM